MGPPSAFDFADQSSNHGIAFRYFDRDGEFRPHSRAGALGDALPRLNDGLAAENDDDIKRCVWTDNEARFYVDLKESIPIARINSYSWHRGERARQFFSLWGSNAEEMPDPGFFRGGEPSGWTLLAVVDTRELGKGGVHGSSVEPQAGQFHIGSFRYLLWIAPQGPGTFFTELDIHAAH